MRFRRAAIGGLMVTALLLLSGCSAEQEGEIKRLAMPVAVDQGGARSSTTCGCGRGWPR